MTVKIDGTNTVANPAFTGADTDTGLQCGTNELKLVTGGTARATVDSSGHVSIGTTTANRTFQVGKSGAETFELEPGEAANNNLSLHYNRSSNQFITNEQRALDHRFMYQSTEKVRINSNGLTFNGETDAAHALNDYEEGTWTAAVRTTSNNSSISVTNSTGYYVKVGKMVTAYYYTGTMNVSAVGTGAAIVSGLPYSVANLTSGYATGTVTHATCFNNQVQNCYADPNLDRVVFIRENTVNALAFTAGNNKYLMVGITYRTEI